MKVVVAYVYPDLDLATYQPMARRFVDSYMDYPSGGYDHELHILVNGGITNNAAYKRLFHPLACSFMMHNNQGKDIGAFQKAAATIPCDLLVCLGAGIHFRRAGWLDRIVQVYEGYGPAFYGCWGFHQPSVHIRTTAFWCAPQLLNSYPYVVHNDARYEFEHGSRSIVNHVSQIGLMNYMVTWDGCYPVEQWHHVENDQCLLLDQHSDRIGYR